MSPAEAKDLLLMHAFSGPKAPGHPKVSGGFLGSLRPYGGHLIEANFVEVMEALRVLGPSLTGEHVDREVMTALWAICHLARAWGLEPQGLLRRNGLIAAADIETLADWVNAISYASMCLLDGAGEEVAFEGYERRRGTAFRE